MQVASGTDLERMIPSDPEGFLRELIYTRRHGKIRSANSSIDVKVL